MVIYYEIWARRGLAWLLVEETLDYQKAQAFAQQYKYSRIEERAEPISPQATYSSHF